MEKPKPGQTISPSSSKSEEPQSLDSGGTLPSQGKSLSLDKSEPTSQWQFKVEDQAANDPGEKTSVAHTATKPLEWSASEFIAHQKSASWYLRLAIAAIIFAALVFLLTHDKISTGVVLFAGLCLGIFGARKPRTLDYKLDESGLKIGEKFYSYDTFKSFAVMKEGAFSSIMLLPLKRFMPALSLYFDPQDESKIANILADRLPFEDRKHDAVDSLMHRIRF